ncbi:MAG: Chorismate synthase [Syntrophomonadaceae bacterium]|nr:Chorismate synthase [Bacillota bacterium]
MRFLTAGESHGKALSLIVDGYPSGVSLSEDFITLELHRRQLGYGRGTRMKIEEDRIEILSGVRRGITTGSPIAALIYNRDWENWKDIMAIWAKGQQEEKVRTGGEGEEKAGAGGEEQRKFQSAGYREEKVSRPRPGHADLAGALKFDLDDIRDVLERSSARETAARVAAGALARLLLLELDIKIFSHVISIGEVELGREIEPQELDQKMIDRSPVRCMDERISRLMMQEIDRAREDGDSVGGIFEVIATGLVAGLGSYVQWDERLDGRIARAVMSIPAVKGVEIGLGFRGSSLRGSAYHDEIFYCQEKGIYRSTNRAGGMEGGMTNGQPLVVRAAMKPISTLAKPLRSVDLVTKEEVRAFQERADVCAVPSAAVVGEAVVALEIANAVQRKFGGDSLAQLKESYSRYKDQIERRLT